jgi:mannose-6-phosphate isomerase class I
MQNSDNVIRGGLTPKFKDVDVLINSLSYDAFQDERVLPSLNAHGWSTWRPLSIFGVTLVNTVGKWKSETAAIGIVLKGSAKVSDSTRTFGWAGVFEPNEVAEISDCSPDFAMYVADSSV